MSSDSKFFLGVVVAALLVIGGLIFYSGRNQSATQSGDTVTIDYAAGQKEGRDEAPVKIVEFGDFQCPACKSAEPELAKALDKNADTVQFIFRHFPLTQIHKNAIPSAVAAEAAAAQGKFWPMHDLLYEKQTAWSALADPTEIFVGYAKELDLDTQKFRDDLKSADLQKKVDDDFTYGESLTVDQTPTFFVNGKRVLGSQTADQWQALIDEAKK